MASDRELLERWRRGEAAAMDRLVDRHAGAVYAFALRFLGDPTLAEDITQEVWLRVLRSGASFDGRGKLTTWLFSIARNACVDHLRRRQRRPLDQAGDLPPLSAGEAPIPERVSQRELSELVARAVAELSDEQREVFVLREHTALTFREIGEALGLPRDTVKSRMRYALEHVRRFVRRATRGEEVKPGGV